MSLEDLFAARATKARMFGASEGSKSSWNIVKMVTSRSEPPGRAYSRRRSIASLAGLEVGVIRG